jgi:hypothetical protein
MVSTGPQRSKGGYHGVGLLSIHVDADETALRAANRSGGRDIGPRAGGRIQFPDLAILHVVWAGLVAQGDIQDAVLVDDRLLRSARAGAHRKITGRLARYQRPGGAGVQRLIQFARYHVADKDTAAHEAIEQHKAEARIRGNPNRESRQLAPRLAVILTFPEPVLACGEEQFGRVERVHCQPLAFGAPVAIRCQSHPHRSRERIELEGLPAIVRIKQIGLVPRVHSGGDVQLVGIVRVERNALRSQIVGVMGGIGEVHQRNPPQQGCVPAVGSPDIGPGVEQALFGGMGHDVGDIAARHNGYGIEGVALARRIRWRRLSVRANLRQTQDRQPGHSHFHELQGSRTQEWLKWSH